MVNSGCYGFKANCDDSDVCNQNRHTARPVLNAKRDGKVTGDRSTLRRAMGFTYLSCSENSSENSMDSNTSKLIKNKKMTTPFRVKEGLVPTPGATKRQSMGNNKFVYDSSDYMKFKRLAAKNKNYSDCSFGGDASNAAQSAMRRRV